MKRILTILSAAILLLGQHAPGQTVPSPKILSLPPGTDIPALKETAKTAIAELMTNFAARQSGSKVQSFVILPLARDIQDGYFTRQFEDAFTHIAGDRDFKLYTREDRQLAAVMKEPEFVSIYEDAVNPATIQKLSLVGAEAVIIPRLGVDVSANGTQVLSVGISVHQVATAQKLWGNEVTKPIPGKLTPEQLVLYVGIGLAALGVLVILVWIKRVFSKASRPR